MSVMTDKPKRGKPSTPAQLAAVALMEQQVCDLRIAGKSFGQIDTALSITNSDRIYARAIVTRPNASRDEAYAVERAELLALRERVREAEMEVGKSAVVEFGVHDRMVKLDGLDHAARIADANLQLDQAKVQMMAGALVDTLRDFGLTQGQQREAVTAWGERLALMQASE